jgi:hypothetical protein
MKDIDLICEIFKERTYDSPIALEFKVSKIQDKRLASGLMVDLFCKSDEYEFNRDTISHFINVENNTPFEDHDYYINFLKSQAKLTFYEFLVSRDIAYCDEFRSWIKSLSFEDIESIVEYCIELEIYEAIPYIKSIKTT